TVTGAGGTRWDPCAHEGMVWIAPGEAHLFWGCPQGGLCPQTCALEYSDRCSRVSTYRLHDIQHRLTDGCSIVPAVRLPLAASMSLMRLIVFRGATQDRRRLSRYMRRWLVEASLLGFNGSAASSSVGNTTPRTLLD